MYGLKYNILVAVCISLTLPVLIFAQNEEGTHSYLDVETPQFFNYNSPLRQPDSLRSRPYFDFLSTLYRRDATKMELFRPYLRSRRDVAAANPINSAEISPLVQITPKDLEELRTKRAIVFRPLFVYRQQEIKRQQLQKSRV